MLGKRVWALLAPVAVVLLAGCQSLASGPDRSVPPAFEAKAFQLSPAWNTLNVDDWTKIPTTDRKVARNEFVTSQMYLIDRAYYRFESTMLQEARTGGFLGEFITAAMTTGSAIIDDREIERFLSTGASTITSGRQAFDKQVMMDRTVQTLQNQMRASRAEVKARILDRLKLDYDNWTIGLAQSDVEDYYQAGTLVGALTAAADSATTRKIEEEDNANLALTSAFQTNAATEALRTYLDFDEKLDPAVRKARRDRAKEIMNAQRIAVGKKALGGIVDFVEGPGREEEKKNLLTALHAGATGADQAELKALIDGLD